MKIINPSSRLLVKLGLTEDDVKYKRTCMSSTCSCASHDSGYHFIEIEKIPDGVEIHTYSGTPRSHPYNVLHEEYVEAHTAKGLPKNAPAWAFTLDTRKYSSGGTTYGEHVEVVIEGEFTVVRHFNHSGLKSAVVNLFATKNGKVDNTAEYKQWNFQKVRAERITELTDAGLTDEEAHRLFQIGRVQWTREQTPRLIEFRNTFRKSMRGLVEMASRVSCRDQSAAAAEWGMSKEFRGLSSPRTQALAYKALWVFHSLREVGVRFQKMAADGLIKNPQNEPKGFAIPDELFAKVQ